MNRSNAPFTIAAIGVIAGVVLAGWTSKPPAVDYAALVALARAGAVAPAQAAPAPAPAPMAPFVAPVKVAPAPAPARARGKRRKARSTTPARLVYVLPFHRCTCGL